MRISLTCDVFEHERGVTMPRRLLSLFISCYILLLSPTVSAEGDNTVMPMSIHFSVPGSSYVEHVDYRWHGTSERKDTVVFIYEGYTIRLDDTPDSGRNRVDFYIERQDLHLAGWLEWCNLWPGLPEVNYTYVRLEDPDWPLHQIRRANRRAKRSCRAEFRDTTTHLEP